MLRRSAKNAGLTADATSTGPPARSNAPRPGPVEVEIEVEVPADQALLWFCDPQRWTRFQGRNAWLDPRPGGRLRVEMADGDMIVGHYLELGADRVAFSWGREGDQWMPPESSTVTVTTVPRGASSTRLLLRHEGLPDRSYAEAHRGGWRYHLVRLQVAATGVTGDTEVVDLFLAAATEPDAVARRGLIERTCAEDVHVADGHDEAHGVTMLTAHLGRIAAGSIDQHLVRTGPIDRIGSLLRSPYVLRRPRPDAEPVDLEAGELVAAIDRRRKLTAVSFFA